MALVAVAGRVSAQDAVFSQFFNSTLYLNPALAGIEKDISVSFAHRSQWRSLLFPYTTSQVSVVMPYYKSEHTEPYGHVGGIGLSVYNDVAGESKNFKTTGLNGSFAYNLPLDHKHINQITFGIQVGMINKRIDPDGLQWGEQYNPFVGFDASIASSEVGNLENTTFFDVNSGIFWWHNPIPESGKLLNSMNAGISASHMNNPNESLISGNESRLPVLYKFHGGIVFNISHHATISANTLNAYQDGVLQNNLGSYLSYKIDTEANGHLRYFIARVGSWYRVNDAVILLAELESPLFKVAFSYDWNTSSLRYSNRGIGTYEIHLSVRFADHAPPKSRY
ncbi:hypothetical protein C900_01085 [Fulvivirga imtechensis AK7]|uniref:Bacteroidetes-specific membrane protein n=1 Tax=Fulvivirga imtechensis AK7 TaxID=1237149 RepID=L8JUM6_9BACT|nr:hypothetical protein C900_01085 [Fulvivirga imtechensis AK7]